jgi:D-methionine transport system permease protein
MLHALFNAIEETLFMVFTAGLLTWIIGLPLGALLSISRQNLFLHSPILYKSLRFVVNTTSSVPYIVLMIATIPLTRAITGSGEGTIAALVPLTLAAVPLFARYTEQAINDVPKGIIEAAQSVGATTVQIVYKVLIPEALHNIINGLTITLIHLIGYSTIAGALGSGGLGAFVITTGYPNFQLGYVLTSVLILLGLIQLIQICGNYIVHGSFKRQE